jgi:hypothetical protein
MKLVPSGYAERFPRLLGFQPVAEVVQCGEPIFLGLFRTRGQHPDLADRVARSLADALMALDAEQSLPARSSYRFSPDQRIQAAVHFQGAVNEVQRPPLHPDECLVYCIHFDVLAQLQPTNV